MSELLTFMEFLINKVVKEKVEVHMEITPETTNIDIQPWKPYEMRCPYAERKDND